MAGPKLQERSLDEWLAAVQPISALGADNQIRAALAVPAKAALVVVDGLVAAAQEVRRLTDATTTFNEEAGKLTAQLVRLNASLTRATWVIAGGTILLVVLGALTIGRGGH